MILFIHYDNSLFTLLLHTFYYSVHVSWSSYFSNLDSGTKAEDAFAVLSTVGGSLRTPTSINTTSQQAVSSKQSSDSLGISYLVRAYQVRGHEAANLDPLGLHAFRSITTPPELDYTYHGFQENDLDRQLNMLGNSTEIGRAHV